MDLSQLETDRTLEIEGVWVNLEDEDKTQLLVARIGNPTYNARIRAKMKPFTNMLKRDAMPMEQQEGIVTQVLSETILLGWKNLKYKGKVIKFTPARAFEIMEGIPDFREMVLEISNSMEAYRLVEQEDDSKNSKAS